MSIPGKHVRDVLGGQYRYTRTELDRARNSVRDAESSLKMAESRVDALEQQLEDIKKFFMDNDLNIAEHLEGPKRI